MAVEDGVSGVEKLFTVEEDIEDDLRVLEAVVKI